MRSSFFKSQSSNKNIFHDFITAIKDILTIVNIFLANQFIAAIINALDTITGGKENNTQNLIY